MARIELLLAVIAFIDQCFAETSVAVTTSLGQVTGYVANFGDNTTQLYHGRADVFLGVPYAQPPVGALRFKKPQPIANLQGVYNSQPKVCPQRRKKADEMSEDCLKLNIFSPNVSATVKYPVMLWIHGGSFMSGAASDYNVDGVVSNFVSHDVVVVVIQYRLGALGFFTTQSDEFPANLGMLDQVEAIKFVRQHIDKFGGDANRLTVFGFSAASAHTYSPLSQSLFQQAIVHSNPIMTSLDGYFGRDKASKKFAKAMCDIDFPAKGEKLTELSQCLAQKSVQQMVDFDKNVFEWKMSIDNYFLTGMPNETFQQRPNIPVIMGNCKDEWSFVDLSKMAGGKATLKSYNKTSVEKTLLKRSAFYGQNAQKVMEFVVGKYKPEGTTDNDHLAWLKIKSNVLTAAGFTSVMALDASYYIQNQNPNVFMYEFDYSSAVGRKYEVPGWKPVPHYAEIPLLWKQNSSWTKAKADVVPADYEVANHLGEMWTTFAKTGFKCDRTEKVWTAVPVGQDKMPYNSIDQQQSMQADFRRKDREVFLKEVPNLL